MMEGKSDGGGRGQTNVKEETKSYGKMDRRLTELGEVKE